MSDSSKPYLQIELGGEESPYGQGYVAAQWFHEEIAPEIRINYLPLDSESVDRVYSSHYLDKAPNLHVLLRELARVCKVGALMEHRIPHWLNSMAMAEGHLRTISEDQVRHWCLDFPQRYFGGCKRRFKMLRAEYITGPAFGDARSFNGWADDKYIMRCVPNACHEVQFHFECIVNEG